MLAKPYSLRIWIRPIQKKRIKPIKKRKSIKVNLEKNICQKKVKKIGDGG